jgi:hypothetical protein
MCNDLNMKCGLEDSLASVFAAILKLVVTKMRRSSLAEVCLRIDPEYLFT